MSDTEQRFGLTMGGVDRDEPGLVRERDGTVWLVNPDGTRTQLPGNGGSQAVLTHKVTLSSADILALNATTYTGPALVAAPTAGKMIVPLSILTVVHFGTAPYVTGSGNSPYVSTQAEYSGPNGGSWFRLAREGTGLSLAFDNAVVSGPDIFDDDVSLAGVNGQPLGLFVNTPYTDGDGTLDVTTFYYLADIS